MEMGRCYMGSTRDVCGGLSGKGLSCAGAFVAQLCFDAWPCTLGLAQRAQPLPVVMPRDVVITGFVSRGIEAPQE
jgi:hypothetical protein